MKQEGANRLALAIVLIACLACAVVDKARAQRDQDQDDFDDSGFDDSGYNSPQSHDAEGSHHNPSNYSPSSEEDLDDDDDADESNNVMAKVAANLGPGQQFHSAANSIALPIGGRQKRSVSGANDIENDIEDAAKRAASQPLVRKRRYSKKYIGPVYTYVKTDKHAHYKWGVKHKVGKHYG